MAKDNWTNGGGDLVFSNPLNWSTGFVPVSSSTSNINAAGTGTYTVTSSVNETVLAITTIPTATLDVTGATSLRLPGPGLVQTLG